MSKIVLRNTYNDFFIPNLYYPRLQINQHGEIVLSLYKCDTLTVGILVGKTSDSKSETPIGERLDDWEVVGPLIDYDGEVSITIKNSVKRDEVL